jgi:hypothetical protein
VAVVVVVVVVGSVFDVRSCEKQGGGLRFYCACVCVPCLCPNAEHEIQAWTKLIVVAFLRRDPMMDVHTVQRQFVAGLVRDGALEGRDSVGTILQC